MSEKAEKIYNFIEPIEELRLKVFTLHDIDGLSQTAQAQIRDAGSSLTMATSELELAAEKQAAHDFKKAMKDR